MKLHVDKETKRIMGYTIVGNPIDDNCDFVDVDLSEEDITGDLFFSVFADGKIILNETLKNETLHANQLKEIRDRREHECFPIINRGALWYNMLSDEYKEELRVWYQAWLDAPTTLVIPQKPVWLQEM